MIMESLDEHLEKLTGYVFDNDKLVTYKWLSKELKVHVNIAKQILWKFYHQYHENGDIECTYLLMGLLKDNKMRVEVVKESNLSEAKEKYSKLISEHLYSVHKSLENLELLADSSSGDINYSAIKCDACKERSDDEMYLLRWGTAVNNITVENTSTSTFTDTGNSAKPEKNSIKKNGFNTLYNMKGKKAKNLKESNTFIQKKDKESMKANKDTDIDENVIKNNKDTGEENNITSIKNVEIIEERENSKEKDQTSQKNTNLSKIENSKEKVSKINSTTKKVSSKNTKKEGLGNFFKKLTSPPKSAENISPKEKNDKTKEETEKNKEQVDKNKKDKKKNSRGKKRNRSKETDNAAIKRKRIFIQSDSSDSEEQTDVEMEEASPEELEPETPAKSKSPLANVKHENGKKKMLKLVNKTYKEGDYIVTKKEHVYVSCSDDEEEKKEDEKKRQAKKVESKQTMKKKQAMLTDFFKKS
ncbi:DNA polymerase delta subunit 3-like [Pseudomyrmex gracilis]|uniref:DNA polymerase delta subunit 3-like n=1 Tax=Pseudomyrmex gracilis TaxID=219809 RepID=UPI0009959F4F|nr:DNA polymerase delta subunit 3-like [Pseudomyrmex gracilis]